MPASATNAVRSFRVIARINLRQARAAKRLGFDRLSSHHLACALESRSEANALRRACRPH